MRTPLYATVLGLALALAPRLPRAELLDRVMAVIDDDAILLSDVRRRARPFLAEVSRTRDPAERERQREEIMRTTLQRMIDDTLVRRAATRAHITVSEQEVDEFISRIAQERGATPEQMYAALQNEGISRTEYRSYMESEVLQLKVLQVRVRGRINITESDLQEAYRRAVRENQGATVPTVAHVFIAVPEDASEADVAAARARAADVTRRVRAGEDFAAVARAESEDTATRESGGDLGEIQAGTLPEALDHELTTMAVGAVSDPVRGPSGFHVLKLTSRRAVEPPPFAQVRDRLYAALLNREMLRHQRIYLRELRRAASIDDRSEAPVAPVPPATPAREGSEDAPAR
ncbi:MAG: peptidylprolyl isomerase [Polyangiales bacterium]